MNTPSTHDRLASLEARCRRLTLAVAALACTTSLALTLGLAGKARNPEIEAARFHLRGGNGDLLGQLAPQGQGATRGGSLLLLGQGKCHADLTAADRPSLTLTDSHGQARIAIGLDAHGEARIQFFDAAGKSTWRAPEPVPIPP